MKEIQDNSFGCIMAAFRRHLPAFTTLFGLMLLIAAWPTGLSLPKASLPLKWGCFALWFFSIFIYLTAYADKRLPKKTIRRHAWVLALFLLLAIPIEARKSDIFAAHTLGMLGILLCVGGSIHWPWAKHKLERIGGWLSLYRDLPAWVWVWFLYSAFLIVAVALSWYCFAFVPAYTDSTAQYIHAKFIAAGNLYGEAHPLREFFPVWMMVADNGKWYSQYQPLHQFILALGHMADTPWMINPIEGALTLVVIYAIARRIYGEATALIAAGLSLGCIFMLIISAEYMNHATGLLFAALFIYCYIESLERKKYLLWWGLAGGLCLGGVFLSRPLVAVGMCIPFVVYALYLSKKLPRLYLPRFLSMSAGGIATLIFQGWYNMQLTGSITMFPYSKYHSNSMGDALGMRDGYKFWRNLVKAQVEWVQMNQSLFQWAVPCTFFILVLFILPVKNRYTRLLIAMLISYTIANMLNQFGNMVFGPRYLYEMLAGVILLSAAGIHRLPVIIRAISHLNVSGNAARGMTAMLIALLMCASLVERFPAVIDHYSNNYMDSHPGFGHMLGLYVKKPALIFIGRPKDGGVAAKNDRSVVKHRWVAYTNPPDDLAPVIFAFDRGDEKNKRLMEYYPDRHAYLEIGNELTPIETMEPMD